MIFSPRCVSVCPCARVSVCLSFFVSLFLCVSLCLSVAVSILYLYLSLCLSACRICVRVGICVDVCICDCMRASKRLFINPRSTQPYEPSDHPLNACARLQVLSWGPCQFATLGFIVDRAWKIDRFVPEEFWSVNMAFDRGEGEGRAAFEWSRGR